MAQYLLKVSIKNTVTKSINVVLVSLLLTFDRYLSSRQTSLICYQIFLDAFGQNIKWQLSEGRNLSIAVSIFKYLDVH